MSQKENHHHHPSVSSSNHDRVVWQFSPSADKVIQSTSLNHSKINQNGNVVMQSPLLKKSISNHNQLGKSNMVSKNGELTTTRRKAGVKSEDSLSFGYHHKDHRHAKLVKGGGISHGNNKISLSSSVDSSLHFLTKHPRNKSSSSENVLKKEDRKSGISKLFAQAKQNGSSYTNKDGLGGHLHLQDNKNKFDDFIHQLIMVPLKPKDPTSKQQEDGDGSSNYFRNANQNFKRISDDKENHDHRERESDKRQQHAWMEEISMTPKRPSSSSNRHLPISNSIPNNGHGCLKNQLNPSISDLFGSNSNDINSEHTGIPITSSLKLLKKQSSSSIMLEEMKNQFEKSFLKEESEEELEETTRHHSSSLPTYTTPPKTHPSFLSSTRLKHNSHPINFQSINEDSQMKQQLGNQDEDAPQRVEVKNNSNHEKTTAIDDEDDDIFFMVDIDEHELLSLEEQAKNVFNNDRKTVMNQEKEDDDDEPSEEYPNIKGLVMSVKNIVRNGKHTTELVLLSQAPVYRDLIVLLQDDWRQTHVQIGDYVAVIGLPSSQDTQEIIVDQDMNFITLHPDILLSATTVADMFACPRKAVLNERIKSYSFSIMQMVVGRILHTIFQKSLQTKQFGMSELKKFAEQAVLNEMESIYFTGSDEITVQKQVFEGLPFISAWPDKYFQKLLPRSTYQIEEVVDIEETLWSPVLGLKGNIDATIKLTSTDYTQKSLYVPLELKTNRKANLTTYQAQTHLYSAMLGLKHNMDPTDIKGLLHFIKQNELDVLPLNRNEFKAMLIGRNNLATYFHNYNLPSTIENTSACLRCHQRHMCDIYHQIEGRGPRQIGENPVVLSESDLIFLKAWESYLATEECGSNVFRHEIWNLRSYERELLGRCIADVCIESLEENFNTSSAINRYRCVFKKRNPVNHVLNSSQLSVEERDLLGLSISVGEPVVISRDLKQYGLAKGFVESITADKIVVGLDKKLPIKTPKGRKIIFRIDTDEMTTGLSNIRFNLFSLFSDPELKRLKSMVVDCEVPTFDWDKLDKLNLPKFQQLNDEQNLAIQAVAAAEDYSLILGMPGTGKTTTLSLLIQQQLSLGKRILLTAYTHTAVDNVLLKCKYLGIDFLRLGNDQKVHPDLQSYTCKADFNSAADVEYFYNVQHRFVAVTCYGIKHPIFKSQKFDLCIVDEASQISVPLCLGPIQYAKKFVLVGDHYQLPPLSKDKSKTSPPNSLFKILSDKHPSAVTTLTRQYRMNDKIMRCVNEFIYDYRMQQGSFEVANAGLQMKPNISCSCSECLKQNDAMNSECWISKSIEPSYPIVLVNTDTSTQSSEESNVLNAIYNQFEIDVVQCLVEQLNNQGVSLKDIGVITPLRAQIKRMHDQYTDFNGLEVDSVDRFQGRDKECIIISFVRSNKSGNTGDLIRDWHRLNVALSRAKTKLVLVMSVKTFMYDSLIGSLIRYIERHGKIVQINNFIRKQDVVPKCMEEAH